MANLVGASCGCHGTHCTLGAMAPQDGAPQPRCPVSWCTSGHRLDAPFHEHALGEVAVGDVVYGVSLVATREHEPRVELWIQQAQTPRFTRLALGQAETLASLLSWAVALGRGEQR